VGIDIKDLPYLDIASTEFSMASDEVANARAQGWAARTSYGLAALRYESVAALLRDPRLETGLRSWLTLNGISGPYAEWSRHALINLEGDDHSRIRRLVNPAFSARAVRSLAPEFRSLSAELVSGFEQTGRCEFVEDFAKPYSARSICITLGIPDDRWKNIAGWAAAIGLANGVSFRANLPQIEVALEGLHGYADELIAHRRVAPKDDLVGRLVDASQDNDRLSTAELRVLVVLLITGGVQTIHKHLGQAIRTFLAHPDQWQQVADDPSLAASAVEETLRVNPANTWIIRRATSSFEYDGVEIDEGTIVHLFTQSAGTDPAAAADVSFDITGERPQHFAFGYGIHHCLGHFVARSEMTEALPVLARSMRDMRVDGQIEELPASGTTGPLRLPLAFTPNDNAATLMRRA
jgi:cytochrome P450